MQAQHDRQRWVASLLVFVATATVYWITAVAVGNTHTPDYAYYDQLAESFAHGRLDLPNPVGNLDLTEHNGKWYVPFPPLPALLMVPWVALAGRAATNTVVVSIVLASASVASVWLLFEALRRRGSLHVDAGKQRWLIVALAVGSVHYVAAVDGSVWYLAQIAAVTFVALGAWLAAERRAARAIGASLGTAMLARPHLVLLAPFLVALARGGGMTGQLGPRQILGRAGGAGSSSLLRQSAWRSACCWRTTRLASDTQCGSAMPPRASIPGSPPNCARTGNSAFTSSLATSASCGWRCPTGTRHGTASFLTPRASAC